MSEKTDLLYLYLPLRRQPLGVLCILKGNQSFNSSKGLPRATRANEINRRARRGREKRLRATTANATRERPSFLITRGSWGVRCSAEARNGDSAQRNLFALGPRMIHGKVVRVVRSGTTRNPGFPSIYNPDALGKVYTTTSHAYRSIGV